MGGGGGLVVVGTGGVVVGVRWGVRVVATRVHAVGLVVTGAVPVVRSDGRVWLKVAVLLGPKVGMKGPEVCDFFFFFFFLGGGDRLVGML